MLLLFFLQLLAIITGSIAAFYGIKNYAKIYKEKHLVFIPILSVSQIIASEILHIKISGKFHVTQIQFLLVNSYVIIELLIIAFYLNKIAKNKLEKNLSILLLLIIPISAIIENLYFDTSQVFEINFIKWIEISIVIPYVIYVIANFISNDNEIYFLKSPTLITLFSILTTRILLGPVSSLEKFLVNNSDKSYIIHFTTSTLTYIFFFVTLTYVFRIIRK